MIDQLSATADCCQQTALEGSGSSPMIIHSSERWDVTSRIVADPAVYSPKPPAFSNPQFPVSSPLTVSSNGADNGRGGSMAVHHDRILVNLKKSGQCHKQLSYKCTLFYKCIFSYCSDL